MHVLFRNFSAISQDGMRTTISYLFLMLVQRGYFGLGINYLLPGLHLACDVSTGPMCVWPPCGEVTIVRLSDGFTGSAASTISYKKKSYLFKKNLKPIARRHIVLALYNPSKASHGGHAMTVQQTYDFGSTCYKKDPLEILRRLHWNCSISMQSPRSVRTLTSRDICIHCKHIRRTP